MLMLSNVLEKPEKSAVCTSFGLRVAGYLSTVSRQQNIYAIDLKNVNLLLQQISYI